MEPSLPQLILPIKLERSPERLTSLGGLVVLEELARAAGVWEKVDRVLKGPQSGRGYQPHEFVQPLVWMLHAGGRRLEDLRELRGEHEVLERRLGRRRLQGLAVEPAFQHRLHTPIGTGSGGDGSHGCRFDPLARRAL